AWSGPAASPCRTAASGTPSSAGWSSRPRRRRLSGGPGSPRSTSSSAPSASTPSSPWTCDPNHWRTTMTTTVNPELERKLRHLRLSGFVQALPVRNQEAISSHLAYVEFLELLVEDELARRRDLLFNRRLKQARIPQVKTFDNFEWSFNPKLPKQLV